MAFRRQPFQGQIGMNETPLTTVISCGEFKAAEQIIESTSDPTYLNDGRGENIPLYMVLSNNCYAKNCRNLKLARLLVEKGASPNLRIPLRDLDLACPSPFEELVVYHEVLKSYVAGVSDVLFEEMEMYFETEELKLEFLTNTLDLDNEKCLPNLESCKKLIEQTSELIDIFLRYGSDPSVLTTFSHKSLFHWVIEHEDIDLAKRFLDTCRVNLNLCDVHGSTPLMDTILRNTPENSFAIYEAMCDTADTVDINACDCCGETALFRAVFAGATEMAVRLCQDGAKLKTVVCLSQVPMSTCKKPPDSTSLIYSGLLLERVSPMTTPFLAPLLADSLVQLRYSHVSTQDSNSDIFHPHKHLLDKIISASVSPLIDHGCFSNQIVASEVTSLLENTNYVMTKQVNPTDLLTLMFGQVSCGLRQLCVRTILDHSLMVSQVTSKLWPEEAPSVFCNHYCEGAVTKAKMEELVKILGLPQPFQIFFDIEAVKYLCCGLIMSYRSMECDQACYEESLFDDDDDDDESSSYEFSSVYADSDSLLFFSSDISEESSEEVDDLSDEDLSGSEEDVDVEDESKETEKSKEDTSKLKKIKYKQDDSSSDSESESENMRVVVETFCEDLAEGVAQDHPNVCCDKYQRLDDESTTTTESRENLTASDSISDSLC
ncbi:uncharacterized protein LOC123508835 [Portunus trituberculatus]|uniref:Uncharacterized protein n=1 Tax=Portunus trituberculatus TaxID=210409 RepID=A0A5B7EA25_PORTR|nr:uncharacterized protein LOC123508835 [Portunus trituberculatus]MPC30207.1 hypothetical protein [Portunus trituberculatus]